MKKGAFLPSVRFLLIFLPPSFCLYFDYRSLPSRLTADHHGSSRVLTGHLTGAIFRNP